MPLSYRIGSQIWSSRWLVEQNIAELIRLYRFGFNEEEKNLIKNSKLLEFEDGWQEYFKF